MKDQNMVHEPSASSPEGQQPDLGMPLTPEARAILERHMSVRVMEALKRGNGVVVYPENFNAILADAALTPSTGG
jgi:hypothetical protein